MGFLSLINSWMFIFPLIVILYYFFRKKYTRKVISSTIFWEEAMHETKASPYLKTLQKNALLFLQVAALLFFVFAMMEPYFKSNTVSGEEVIIVLDTSATMDAGEKNTIFNTHKESILSLVKQLDGQPLTLITTGSQPQILIRNETNRAEFEKILKSVELTYEHQFIENSLEVIQSMISNQPTSIYVYTDALEKEQLPLTMQNVAWHIYGQDKKLENVAITKFAAIQQNNDATILLKISNETDQLKNVSIYVKDSQGHEATDEVTIEANEEISHLLTSTELTGQLSASIEVDDSYKVDNFSYTMMQKPNVSVVLDESVHVLVQKGFTSVYDDVIYADPSTNATSANQLIVTNKVELLKGEQRIFLIGRNDVESVEVSQYASPSSHALFTFSPLDNVYVQRLYPAFDEYEVIATVGDQPFIQRTDRGDIIVLADVQATDWPMHPVFPLFLWSVLQQYTLDSDYIGSFTPKQQASIVAPDQPWSIFTAEGEFVEEIESIKQFIAPAKPGIYTLKNASEQKIFTVDIAQIEKTIQNGSSYSIGELEDAEEAEVQKSFVPWLIPIIILLLLIEWEVQRRRGFTN